MTSMSHHAMSQRQLLDTLPLAGQLVRRARELRRMSLLDVAGRIGCKPNFVSMVEDSRSALPPKRAQARARRRPAILVLRTMAGKHEGPQVAIARLASLIDQVLPTLEEEVDRVRRILGSR